MKSTLTIKDLPVAEELDRKAMAAVHGGERKTMNQVVAETVQMLQAIGSGKGEFSATGKSFVIY